MNERYAADPGLLANALYLKSLVEKFGIDTGRYLIQYPSDWEARVLEQLKLLSPIESERAKVALRRAKERLAFPEHADLEWVESRGWVANARRMTSCRPPKVSCLIAGDGDGKSGDEIIQLDEIDWPPTAEERVSATVKEYRRVCEIVIKHSFEVFLVDPFADPSNVFVRKVLQEVFSLAGSPGSKCKRVVLFVRQKVITGGDCARVNESVRFARVKEQIRRLLQTQGLEHKLVAELVLVDDSCSSERMHDRYLFSVKGGIEISQGFQTLRDQGKVTVRPMSSLVHIDTWRTFIERKTDMNFAE